MRLAHISTTFLPTRYLDQRQFITGNERFCDARTAHFQLLSLHPDGPCLSRSPKTRTDSRSLYVLPCPEPQRPTLQNFQFTVAPISQILFWKQSCPCQTIFFALYLIYGTFFIPGRPYPHAGC